MAVPVCQLHSKVATSVCLSHEKFLCKKCLLEKVDEGDSCRKQDLTELTDVKDTTYVNFLKIKQFAIKTEEQIQRRLAQIDKEHDYLVQRVNEDRGELIDDINAKATTVLMGIEEESRKLKSKYEKYLQEIDEKAKLIETDVKSQENDNVEKTKGVQAEIDMMNTALKHKYIVFGTVSADFETKKTIKETLKNYDVLGDLVFTEKEDYENFDKNEGVANKAFVKDDSKLGNSKESKRQESTVYKDVSRGSVMYDDSNVKQTLTGKEYAHVNIKAQAAKYKKKDEKTDPSISSEKNTPPVPPRSSLKLKSKESGNSFSRCCCNLI